MYEYRMVQVPPGVITRATGSRGDEAAAYLEGVVRDNATDGWEFFRVDRFEVVEARGCFNVITLGRFGAGESSYDAYVITFRRKSE